MAKFHVLIPAAGNGSRMASEIPKQYLPLLGKPLITYCLNTFIQNSRVDSINVILSQDDAHWPKCNIVSTPRLHIHHCGGDTRAATVLNGLDAMQHVAADDWVLVHDAARPGLTDTLLNRLLDSLQDDMVGGLLAIPLADTLKRADKADRVVRTEPRADLWQAQTPQMFRYATLKKALEHAGGTPTDEAQAIEAVGLQPKLVSGELRNMKITYPQDLALAAAILKADQVKENTND